MEASKHSKKRCVQRGVKKELVDIITNHGDQINLPGQGLGYYLPRGRMSSIRSNLKQILQLLEKADELYIVKNNSNHIITAYRADTAKRKKNKHNQRNQSGRT